MGSLFSPGASEGDISEAIVSEFTRKLKEYIRSDVIVAGAGPAGLMAAYKLSIKGLKVLIVEQNNYLGGGLWLGGYLMNPVTIRAPANRILDELGVEYREYKKGLYVTSGPLLASKLIARTLEAGAEVLNMTSIEDLVVRKGRVSGVVVNWTPVQALPRQITCVDPIALESKVVIDATGHDAKLARRLSERGILKSSIVGPMWVGESEDLVVENTKEIYPGLIVAGMSVAEYFGLPRMGPTFGAMLLSGEKAAELAYKLI